MSLNVFNRRFLWAASVLLISLLAGSSSLAQTVSLTGGNISLTFATPTAGSDFSDVVDNTSCSLSWNRPSGPGNNRITVQTNVSSPTATLTVEAINISGGQGQGTVTLSTTAQNLVIGLMIGNGGCDLEYTASASLTDGTATDVHTVTYTITG